MPSAIDPDAIPGRDIDPDTIELHAATVTTVSGQVRDHGAAVHTKWQGMAAVYEAPESGIVLDLMQPVNTQSTQVGDNLSVVSQALSGFAEAVRPIKAALDQLRLDAQAFRAEIAGGVQVQEVNPAYTAYGAYGTTAASYQGSWNAYGAAGSTSSAEPVEQYRTVTKEWHEVQEYVDRNNDLIAQVNAQQVLLWEAERDCANTIRALYGADPLRAAQSEDDALGYGIDEIPEGTEMPWGAEVERTEGCGEATANFVFKDFLWEGIAVGGIWGTVEGLGTLVLGYNPATGDFFSGDAYGAAWGNLGNLLFAGAANVGVLAPIFHADTLMQQFGGDGFLPQEVRDFKAQADEAAINTGKALIAWDKWADDPGTALGESVFNVGTALIPVGGAAVAGVKTASTAASVLSRMARVADFVDPAAWAVNGTMRLGSAGLGSLDNLIGRLDTPPVDVNLGPVEVYTATDSASAMRILDEVGVDPQNVYARVDEAGTPVLEFPGGVIEMPAGSFDNAAGGSVRAGDGGAETSVPAPVREPELVGAGGVRGESTVIREPETAAGGGSGPDSGHGGGDGSVGDGGGSGDADDGYAAGDADAGTGDSSPDASSSDNASSPQDASAPVAWQSSEDPGLTLTESQKAVVDDFLAGSRTAEPRLTETVQSIAARHPEARLEGLDFRLKSDESLYRKVADDLQDSAPGVDAREIVAGMKDTVRYTYVVADDAYTPTVSGILDDLQNEGLVPFGPLKNAWGSDGYVGINSTFFDPQSSRVIEVQFHTDASFDAKMAVHDLYEQARLPSVDPELRAELDAAMNDVFGSVPRPDGAPDIGWPEPRPGNGYFDTAARVDPEPMPSGHSAAAIDEALVDRSLVDAFDARTPEDGVVFWSGRVTVGDDFVSAMDGAGVFAQSQRSATLEQMLAEQGLLEQMPGDWSRPETAETWRAVSSSIAENAKGDVVAYIGAVREGSVWNQYELPRLIANQDVTSITIIDAHTGRPLHVYQR
ncbi:hypothetical protein HDC37_000067 [Microbacterium sp. AK009]|uniref:hypothetical protein n=1 Tax=Microbacterium sp. AK009 TaxID=2723068 RepID=UPI0015CB6D0C|nr:hypothetical protein [Microbacterium sp. AK009]NYF15255.1 hypothetical protein [Microbacterium sp. AK009]